MNGAKKAALRLLGISTKDRNWILKQLSIDDRAHVEDALRSLKGIEGSEAVSFESVMQIDEEHRRAEQAKEHELNAVPFEVVADALNNLSDVVLTTFLRSNIWKGSARFKDSLPEDRFKRLKKIEECLIERPAVRVEHFIGQYLLNSIRGAPDV